MIKLLLSVWMYVFRLTITHIWVTATLFFSKSFSTFQCLVSQPWRQDMQIHINTRDHSYCSIYSSSVNWCCDTRFLRTCGELFSLWLFSSCALSICSKNITSTLQLREETILAQITRLLLIGLGSCLLSQGARYFSKDRLFISERVWPWRKCSVELKLCSAWKELMLPTVLFFHFKRSYHLMVSQLFQA